MSILVIEKLSTAIQLFLNSDIVLYICTLKIIYILPPKCNKTL